LSEGGCHCSLFPNRGLGGFSFMRGLTILLPIIAAACTISGPPEPRNMTPAEAWATLPTPEFVARAERVWARAQSQRDDCRKLTPERTAEVVRRSWSSTDAQMVDLICGYIWVGMTRAQLLLSWGDPNRINRSVGSWGTHEQWVYGLSSYVYVEQGKVTSYQVSR
jgi:hypothetical protein